MVITQIGRKIVGCHHASLGDIVRISLKWAFFAHFLRAAWGEFYKSWLNRTNFNLSD